MATETLLQPISGDLPCGSDMSFSTEFDRVQALRREDDASLPQGEFVTDLKVADWQGAASLCEELLKTRTKDLRLAGWLVEGSGYGAAFGLAAGFMGLGALVLFPLRLYRGSGRTPPFAA